MNRSKRKGDDAEREVQALLRDLLGDAGIRRALGAGRRDDVGDIHGIEQTVVQVAAWADALRAVREKPVEAEAQRARAGAAFAVTMVRLRGGVWRAVMTPEQLATMWREATGPHVVDATVDKGQRLTESSEPTRSQKAQLTRWVRQEASRLATAVERGEITRAELERAAAETGDGEPILALQYLDRRAKRRRRRRRPT